MPIRTLSTVTVALLAGLPAVAQERPLHVEVQSAVEQAALAAAHASHATVAILPAMSAALPHAAEHATLAAALVPAALAAVEPTLDALEPVLASLAADVHAAVLPALGSIHVSFSDGDVVTAPEPWADQDPADSVYRAARRALNDQDYARAAQLFARIRSESRFRNSEYRATAYYYEAFARQRIGGRAELQRARAVLDEMRREHAQAWREQRDAPALLARINADLARQGDARAAEEVQVRSTAAARSACTDANMAVRVEALNALLQMDAESALPILEEVMKKRGDDCSAELRRKAVFLISQKRSERTTDLLLEAARNDPDPEVQEQAVFWLSQVRDERAVGAIEHILKTSSSEKLQERAIFALSQHRSPRSAELLRSYAMRTDAPEELRGQAIFWLSQTRGQDNARFLQEIYPRLNSRALKEKTLFAVSQVRGEGSGEWLLARAMDGNEHVELRKNALFWAGQLRAIPIARLDELYGRVGDREMKEQVIFVLSQRARDAEAVDVLMKVAKTEKDPELRKQAIFWLGQSRDPRASKFLLDLIRN